MNIYGLTEAQIREAVEGTSRRFADNIEIRQLERVERPRSDDYYKVRLGAKVGRGGDGKPTPGATVYRSYNSRDGVRVVNNANWEAHGTFMALCYVLNPRCKIEAGSISSGGVRLRSRFEMERHWPPAREIFVEHWLTKS